MCRCMSGFTDQFYEEVGTPAWLVLTVKAPLQLHALCAQCAAQAEVRRAWAASSTPAAAGVLLHIRLHTSIWEETGSCFGSEGAPAGYIVHLKCKFCQSG